MNPPMPMPRAEATQIALATAWQKRRKWSRTDTQRFLDDRSEAVLAILRRRRGYCPLHSHAVGLWLRTSAPRIFNRAHTRLLAAPDDEARSRLLPTELL